MWLGLFQNMGTAFSMPCEAASKALLQASHPDSSVVDAAAAVTDRCQAFAQAMTWLPDVLGGTAKVSSTTGVVPGCLTMLSLGDCQCSDAVKFVDGQPVCFIQDFT
jgi:hypothetical protein